MPRELPWLLFEHVSDESFLFFLSYRARNSREIQLEFTRKSFNKAEEIAWEFEIKWRSIGWCSIRELWLRYADFHTWTAGSSQADQIFIYEFKGNAECSRSFFVRCYDIWWFQMHRKMKWIRVGSASICDDMSGILGASQEEMAWTEIFIYININLFIGISGHKLYSLGECLWNACSSARANYFGDQILVLSSYMRAIER